MDELKDELDTLNNKFGQLVELKDGFDELDKLNNDFSELGKLKDELMDKLY